MKIANIIYFTSKIRIVMSIEIKSLYEQIIAKLMLNKFKMSCPKIIQMLQMLQQLVRVKVENR